MTDGRTDTQTDRRGSDGSADGHLDGRKVPKELREHHSLGPLSRPYGTALLDAKSAIWHPSPGRQVVRMAPISWTLSRQSGAALLDSKSPM